MERISTESAALRLSLGAWVGRLRAQKLIMIHIASAFTTQFNRKLRHVQHAK